MNAQFQRTARRDKKAFLTDQCKEIEENNRMGKTRDPFKKIRDTKGKFHAKMGTIKVWTQQKQKILRFSHVKLFTTLWTVARQAPLSMGILQARILEWAAMPSSRGS